MTFCHLPNSALGLSAPPNRSPGMAMNDCHQNLDCDMDTNSLFFDLSKALDTLPHPVILDALAEVGDLESMVYHKGPSSDHFSLFLHMNSLTSLSLFANAHLILYADDILAYKLIRSHLDMVALQNVVNIVNWIESTGLKLNPTKTKLMVLCSRLHSVQPQIIMAGCQVAQVTSSK